MRAKIDGIAQHRIPFSGASADPLSAPLSEQTEAPSPRAGTVRRTITSSGSSWMGTFRTRPPWREGSAGWSGAASLTEVCSDSPSTRSKDIRNRWAHEQAFSRDDVERARNTIRLIAESIGAPPRARVVPNDQAHVREHG
jgi:hypothetical protein